MRFFVQSSNIRKKPHRAAKKLKKCTTAPRCCFLPLLFLCCCFLLLLLPASVVLRCCFLLLLPSLLLFSSMLLARRLCGAAALPLTAACGDPFLWDRFRASPGACKVPSKRARRHADAASVHAFLKPPWCCPAHAIPDAPLQELPSDLMDSELPFPFLPSANPAPVQTLPCKKF